MLGVSSRGIRRRTRPMLLFINGNPSEKQAERLIVKFRQHAQVAIRDRQPRVVDLRGCEAPAKGNLELAILKIGEELETKGFVPITILTEE